MLKSEEKHGPHAFLNLFDLLWYSTLKVRHRQKLPEKAPIFTEVKLRVHR